MDTNDAPLAGLAAQVAALRADPRARVRIITHTKSGVSEGVFHPSELRVFPDPHPIAIIATRIHEATTYTHIFTTDILHSVAVSADRE